MRCSLELTFAQLEETPIGPISFMAGDRGVCRVAFSDLMTLKESLSLSNNVPSLQGLETLATLLVEMNAYLFGIQRTFSVDIDWDVVGGFQRQVLRITAEIPFGGTSSYGAIAELMGKPGAARAVGVALSRNPLPIIIPCHRVVGSDHQLHGYIAGVENKAFLLRLEGHTVTNYKIEHI
jgi:methylated-DNA-[protein]-cysteine S-methyltransferase